MITENPNLKIRRGVEVIIINWNTRQLLYDCLATFFEQITSQLPPDFELQVTVVDNASSDDSVEMVQRNFSQVKLICNEKNVGFATANNQAMAVSDFSYFLLLNSDTLSLPESFKPVFDFMEQHPQAAIVAPRLLNGDKSLQVYCWKFPYPRLDLVNFLELYRFPAFFNKFFPNHMVQANLTEPVQTDFVSGACFLIRQEAYQQTDGFDPAYFFYNEESDWCYRLGKLGWQVWYIPAAKLIHLGGQSSQKVQYNRLIWFHKGYLRFYKKFKSSGELVRHKGAVVIAVLLKLLALLVLVPFSTPERRTHRLKLIETFWKVIWLKAED